MHPGRPIYSEGNAIFYNGSSLADHSHNGDIEPPLPSPQEVPSPLFYCAMQGHEVHSKSKEVFILYWLMQVEPFL